MDKKITALVAAVVAVVVIAAAVWALNPDGDDGKDEGSDTVFVTDMTGEEVEVTLPVERVAITSSSLLDMFIILAGEDWADYVCMMPSDLQTREPAKYDLLRRRTRSSRTSRHRPTCTRQALSRMRPSRSRSPTWSYSSIPLCSGCSTMRATIPS